MKSPRKLSGDKVMMPSALADVVGGAYLGSNVKKKKLGIILT